MGFWVYFWWYISMIWVVMQNLYEKHIPQKSFQNNVFDKLMVVDVDKEMVL